MTATFNPSLTDAISRVRQNIGDVDTTKALVQDETITAYLPLKGELGTSAQLAWDLAARFAGMVDAEVDNQEIKASQRSKQYAELAKRLEAQAVSGAGATAGGFSGIAVTGLDDCRGPDLSHRGCCL